MEYCFSYLPGLLLRHPTWVHNHSSKVGGPVDEEEGGKGPERMEGKLGTSSAGQRHPHGHGSWHESCLRDWKPCPVTVSHPGISTLLQQCPAEVPGTSSLPHVVKSDPQGLWASASHRRVLKEWHGYLPAPRCLLSSEGLMLQIQTKNAPESFITPSLVHSWSFVAFAK